MTESYHTLTRHELRVCYGMVYQCLQRERKMRQRVFAAKPAELTRKLREIDEAIESLNAIKDFAKQHVEESPDDVEPQQGELLPGHSPTFARGY